MALKSRLEKSPQGRDTDTDMENESVDTAGKERAG